MKNMRCGAAAEEEINKTYVIFRIVGVVLVVDVGSGNLALEVIEEGARWIGRPLGVQVDDMHQRSDD